MNLISSLLKKIMERYSAQIYAQMKEIEKKEWQLRNEKIKRSLKFCGDGVGFWGSVHISGAENIVIGNNVHIGANAFIRGEGGLVIGDNTHISRNLVLYTLNHDYKGRRLPYDENMIHKPVTIGKNVWIGMNVCIAPGTTIHDGAIVGMGTVVSGEVPPLAIIGNEKWRILGYRDETHYEELERLGSFGGPNGVEYRNER